MVVKRSLLKGLRLPSSLNCVDVPQVAKQTNEFMDVALSLEISLLGLLVLYGKLCQVIILLHLGVEIVDVHLCFLNLPKGSLDQLWMSRKILGREGDFFHHGGKSIFIGGISVICLLCLFPCVLRLMAIYNCLSCCLSMIVLSTSIVLSSKGLVDFPELKDLPSHCPLFKRRGYYPHLSLYFLPHSPSLLVDSLVGLWSFLVCWRCHPPSKEWIVPPRDVPFHGLERIFVFGRMDQIICRVEVVLTSIVCQLSQWILAPVVKQMLS
eukprot:Gb_41274 [translate_table: standard]